MARRSTQWFTEDGRPIMHGGIYKNTPDGDFLYDFRTKGHHKKGSTGTKIESVARAHGIPPQGVVFPCRPDKERHRDGRRNQQLEGFRRPVSPG